jgi:hypothetical protein
MIVAATLLVLALLDPTTPETSSMPPQAPSTPPPTIVRLKSTPFCQAMRDDVFHVVQGLLINDSVIDGGQLLLGKWAHDSVAAGSSVRGGGPKMDAYQIGQITHQAAQNLDLVRALLEKVDHAIAGKNTPDGRDLASIQQALQKVVDAQERSLNILSGTYETASLYQLLARNDPTASAVNPSTSAPAGPELGDPILPTTPGVTPPPTIGLSGKGSLFSSTPIGQIASGLDVSRHLTGDAESTVLGVVQSGVDRCRE